MGATTARLIALALLLAACLPLDAAPPGTKFSLVPAARTSDPSAFERRSAEEAEIVIIRPGPLRRGGSLLTFHLDRKPIATFQPGEAIRIYLRPGPHRFGVLPAANPGLYRISELSVEVKKPAKDEPQIYIVFQNSGGSAVFEIRRYVEPAP